MMLAYELTDLAIGPFSVGVASAEILARSAQPVERFKREDELFLSLHSAQLQLSLDASGTVQFIEAFEPLQVTKEGQPLIGLNMSKIKALFGRDGLHRVMGSDMYICLKHGVAFQARSSKVFSVAVFRAGYYDGLPLEAIPTLKSR